MLVVDVIYPENLFKEHQYLPFLPNQTKINKVNKLTCDLCDKKQYSIYIATLKQALVKGLNLETVHSAINFKQDAWLKPYVDKNTNLRMHATN